MPLHAAGPRRDVAITPGYARALDGLRAFDDLSSAISTRRDAVVRGIAQSPAGPAYPSPAFGSPAAVGTAIGAAVAAFVGSEAGHAAIERAVHAASGFLRGILDGGAHAQLPLPFE